jgi:uncharacterized membrane-anchored protein
MKIAASPRPASRTAGDTGTARVDRRTARLLTRLGPGDVAVIDHVDLDRGTAQALADAGVAAVVNAQPMISGRFPNLGPEVLLDAGVTMVDGVGPQALRRIRDGARVHLDGHDVLVDGAVVATGRRLEADDVAEQLAAARSGLAAHLDSFTHNSTELLRREQRLLLGGEGLPVLAARLEGRTALVVLPGDEAASQLAQVRRFVRRRRPVLIGVDAGGDVLLDAGHRPDLLVLSAAALEDISAQVLARAREVVVRGEPGSGTAAWDAVERVAHRPHRVHTSLTSEDTALLLAHTGGASPIVAVGARAGLEDLLERGRTGLPSTFLTRLKTGPELVEARLLPALTPRRRRLGPLLLVLLVLALVAAAAAAPASRDWVRDRARDVQDRVGTSGPSAAGAPTARATAADPRSGQPADQAFDDAFAAAAASRVYADGLADRRVSVVTLPGAPADVVAGLTDQV